MLLHGDCLDHMAGMEDGCVDLTVTSPPYDNLRTYNGSLNDWIQPKWEAILAELFRVTKAGGVVVWIVGDATVNGSETGTSFRQALHAKSCGFRLHDTMIFSKNSGIPTQDRYRNEFEYMFIFSKGKPKALNFINDHANKSVGKIRRRENVINKGEKKYTGGEYVTPEFSRRTNIWNFSARALGWEQAKGGYKHPAPFPEALARDHILSWSNEGDTVFDPFTGSGTTGKMALAHGRKFIGIERDAEYFAIAQRRIAEARNATPLLAAAE
jgi:DNA modification methylase